MVHIYPTNDLKEHEMTTSCFCHPLISDGLNGELLCTHNSLDGREGLELANNVLNGTDQTSDKAKEDEVIEFLDNGVKTKGIVITVQRNPTKYFIEDENGRYWHIDESDLITN